MWAWFILAALVGHLVSLWASWVLARAAATYSPNDDEVER